MLLIVITTTLMSLRTPRPLKVMPLIMSAQDTMTIVASNRLKPSIINAPDEANVFRNISVAKMVRKMKSIVSRSLGSMVNSADIVRSNRMKTEYMPIVSSDKFSIY